MYRLKLFQPNVAFHTETNHLLCKANQITGFYMKRKTGLKWVHPLNYPPETVSHLNLEDIFDIKTIALSFDPTGFTKLVKLMQSN